MSSGRQASKLRERFLTVFSFLRGFIKFLNILILISKNKYVPLSSFRSEEGYVIKSFSIAIFRVRNHTKKQTRLKLSLV